MPFPVCCNEKCCNCAFEKHVCSESITEDFWLSNLIRHCCVVSYCLEELSQKVGKRLQDRKRGNLIHLRMMMRRRRIMIREDLVARQQSTLVTKKLKKPRQILMICWKFVEKMSHKLKKMNLKL